jgi:hypothetical protein
MAHRTPEQNQQLATIVKDMTDAMGEAGFTNLDVIDAGISVITMAIHLAPPHMQKRVREIVQERLDHAIDAILARIDDANVESMQ